MTFLHPWAVWIGAAAATLPVLIHMLTRPRPVRVPLSTIRFVREVLQQRRSRQRLRDWLILALRALAILLLAFAVARPQPAGRPAPAPAQQSDVVRVVVVDTSQSMAATERGIQAIERARTRAAQFLRYQPGLRANLILAAARPHQVFEEPSTNFEAMRDELARCRALPERLHAGEVLQRAARMLTPTSPDDPRRFELVIVSDFQRTSWAVADFTRLPAGTEIQLESVAPPAPPANLAITGVDCDLEETGGRGLRLGVDVSNYGPAQRKVTLEIALGEKTYQAAGVCAAGQSTRLYSTALFLEEGWISGRVRLLGIDDALAADNVRPVALQVRAKPTYALITRQRASQRPSSSHFLQCAVAPEGPPLDDTAAGVVRVEPGDLDRRTLGAASLILLDHPGKLAETSIALLADLMRRGRPILYVAAETIDATNLKRLAQATGGSTRMPVEFVPPPQARRDLFLASLRRNEPPFRVFGEAGNSLIGQLRFAGGLGSQRLAGGLADEVLATFADGSAFLTLTPVDAGTLAVLNVDLAASDLPRTPVFLPLIQELVGRITARQVGLQAAICGEPLVVALPGDIESAAGLQVHGPAEVADAAAGETPGELSDQSGEVVWRWSEPKAPGVYQVRSDESVVFCVAVELPAEESELASLPADVLQSRLGAGRRVYYHNVAQEGPNRDDAWTWLLSGCVVCMLLALSTLLISGK